MAFISSKKERRRCDIPDVREALERVMPARINRVEVRDGEVLYRDLTAPRDPKIWVHEMELAVENLATRSKLAGGRPVMASGSAKLGRSGDVTMFVSANPFATKLEFAGQLAVKGWKVAELFDLIEPATDLQTPEGTLDVFAEFTAANGRITGGVKPVLKNVKVRPTEDDFGNKLKAWLADKGLRLFSDRVPDRNAVVTIVPIKGRLDQPDMPAVADGARRDSQRVRRGHLVGLHPPAAARPPTSRKARSSSCKRRPRQGRGAAGGPARRRTPKQREKT